LLDEDTHLTQQAEACVNGMYLKKRTVEVFCLILRSDRKNLAVHVSLSSNLHNVKELTPGASLDGGVGGGGASEFRGQ